MWEEWEQLKAAAAGRHRAGTRLDRLPADQGGTCGSGTAGRLRSDRKAWSAAGRDVGELRDGIGTALTKLEHGQTGLDKGPRCLTAVAQKGVYDSWERRVKDIGELCDGLVGVLEKTGEGQLRTDEAVRAEIARLIGASGKGG
ncbi:hypothetical protein [Streptomyces nodosus]|uniref:hypothetical protein n=1 Tax=Streptomyces nodosus TaxID=40318 RepID=UPI0013719076|nr:hypothetical protein [Streptomyces sp. SID2888]